MSFAETKQRIGKNSFLFLFNQSFVFCFFRIFNRTEYSFLPHHFSSLFHKLRNQFQSFYFQCFLFLSGLIYAIAVLCVFFTYVVYRHNPVISRIVSIKSRGWRTKEKTQRRRTEGSYRNREKKVILFFSI